MKMGVADARIEHSVKYLSGLYRENGYPCVSSMENFRGPGAKNDFCPIASLYSLKSLNLKADIVESDAAAVAVESLLHHWEKRGEKKYYLFGIGTDFVKIKYPMIWYNILHVLSVISNSRIGSKDCFFIIRYKQVNKIEIRLFFHHRPGFSGVPLLIPEIIDGINKN